MKKKSLNILFKVILSIGCGCFLTLLSCLYSYSGNVMYLDVVPTKEEHLQFGFPFPIFSSYAAWWGNWGILEFSVTFVWLGALLDVVIYAFVVWIIFALANAASARVAK